MRVHASDIAISSSRGPLIAMYVTSTSLFKPCIYTFMIGRTKMLNYYSQQIRPSPDCASATTCLYRAANCQAKLFANRSLPFPSFNASSDL